MTDSEYDSLIASLADKAQAITVRQMTPAVFFCKPSDREKGTKGDVIVVPQHSPDFPPGYIQFYTLKLNVPYSQYRIRIREQCNGLNIL